MSAEVPNFSSADEAISHFKGSENFTEGAFAGGEIIEHRLEGDQWMEKNGEGEVNKTEQKISKNDSDLSEHKEIISELQTKGFAVVVKEASSINAGTEIAKQKYEEKIHAMVYILKGDVIEMHHFEGTKKNFEDTFAKESWLQEMMDTDDSVEQNNTIRKGSEFVPAKKDGWEENQSQRKTAWQNFWNNLLKPKQEEPEQLLRQKTLLDLFTPTPDEAETFADNLQLEENAPQDSFLNAWIPKSATQLSVVASRAFEASISAHYVIAQKESETGISLATNSEVAVITPAPLPNLREPRESSAKEQQAVVLAPATQEINFFETYTTLRTEDANQTHLKAEINNAISNEGVAIQSSSEQDNIQAKDVLESSEDIKEKEEPANLPQAKNLDKTEDKAIAIQKAMETLPVKPGVEKEAKQMQDEPKAEVSEITYSIILPTDAPTIIKEGIANVGISKEAPSRIEPQKPAEIVEAEQELEQIPPKPAELQISKAKTNFIEATYTNIKLLPVKEANDRIRIPAKLEQTIKAVRQIMQPAKEVLNTEISPKEVSIKKENLALPKKQESAGLVKHISSVQRLARTVKTVIHKITPAQTESPLNTKILTALSKLKEPTALKPVSIETQSSAIKEKFRPLTRKAVKATPQKLTAGRVKLQKAKNRMERQQSNTQNTQISSTAPKLTQTTANIPAALKLAA